MPTELDKQYMYVLNLKGVLLNLKISNTSDMIRSSASFANFTKVYILLWLVSIEECHFWFILTTYNT